MSVETRSNEEPEARTQRAPARSPRRRIPAKAVIASAVVALAAMVVTAAFVISGGDDGNEGGTVSGSEENAFTISYPASWQPLPKDQIARLRGRPLAVIRRKDGKGYLVVRREPGRTRSFRGLSADLTRELKKRVPDFRRRTSRTIRIKAGPAFFTTYVRRRTGTVHGVVVVPAGSRTFTLNTVSRGGADDVARETGRMILSFDVKR